MPFTTNARRVHIDFDKLQATLQKLDGSWNETSFDLDTLIGNDYGMHWLRRPRNHHSLIRNKNQANSASPAKTS
jgi:hypothetical protein